MFERRVTATEIRAEGRKLSGTVMRFGDVSPSHRERFEPGSIRLADAVHLDLYHDIERVIAWHPGGGLKLSQTAQALTLRAKLPPIPAADRALAEIRAGHTTGLSVEFQAKRERRESGLRVIEAAELRGIGLVKSPSYQQSQVEARRRSGRRLRAQIPVDQSLVCECIAQGGAASGCIPMVRLQRVMADEMAGMIERAYAGALESIEAESRVAGNDVIAVFKDYARPLASARKGTLRAVAGDNGLEIEIDLPMGEAGDMAVAASESVGVIARPLLDYGEGAKFEDTPEGRVVEKARLRAILIGSTDARGGWPDAQIIDDDLNPVEGRKRRSGRRIWL